MRLFAVAVQITLVLLAGFRPVSARASTSPGHGYLKGFVRALAGDQLDYNCFTPLATTALLTRCTTGEMNITWETEPIPPECADPSVTFKWVVSYSTMTSAGDRRFDFLINDQKAFEIRTQRGSNQPAWIVHGKEGAELRFELVREDAARDANGYMYLTVPVARFGKGVPLRLTVVGEKANSSDWFMTFLYDLREAAVELLALPYLMQDTDGLKQTVCLVVTYAGKKGSAEFSVDGGKRRRIILAHGPNTVSVGLPAVEAAREVLAAVSVDGGAAEHFSALIKPVRRRTIYLLPHAHTDIGYTDIQTEVLKKHVRNIYDALELIKVTASYPPEARFKWNTEVSWAVEEFLAKAREGDRAQFFAAVRNGCMSIQALYANELTGIMRPEEYFRLSEFARSLKSRFGVSVTTAMMSDVPGMSWNMVPAMAQAGVKYFSSGPNGTYLGGDRTGNTNRAWADRPFYWVSPSGAERILYWMTGFGYGSFFAGMTSGQGQHVGFLRSLVKYFDWLDQIGYPYDMIQMRHTINGDNGTVDPDLSRYVRDWNERYVSPRIVIATTEQLFGDFEKKYGNVLPAVGGDFTPYWEDGAASSAFELGVNRTTSEHLLQSEALSAILAPEKYSSRGFENAWKQVLLFDEHTWGAHNSISDPDSSFQREQWGIKRGFAIAGEKTAGTLRHDILVATGEGPSAVEVVNTNSWPRTDIVVLPVTEGSAGDVVRDEDGTTVPSQRLTTGELAFLAKEVPALGARRYALEPGRSTFSSCLRVSASSLSDGAIDVGVDPVTGAINRLRTQSPMVEYVDTSGAMGLNEYLYVAGLDAGEAQRNARPTITVGEQGPLVASLVVTSPAPGCNRVVREIRLVHGTGRVEIINTIEKTKVRTKEGVHFGFPFAVAEGVVRVDLGYAVMRPEADQLPGSCKDYFCAQRWVDVSNQSYGVTLTVSEAPLVEVGDLNSEIPSPRNPYWKTEQGSSSRIASYVMNNYWHTNYKADQEGATTFHYSIVPHGQYDQVEVMRAGIERSQPLVGRWVPRDVPPVHPLFSVSPRSVFVSYLKPLPSARGYLVRLFNAGGRQVEALMDFGRNRRSVYHSSLAEEKGKRLGSVSIPANGIVTLWIE